MTKAAAEITKPKADEPVPVRLMIDPKNCGINAHGFSWKEMAVRLPSGFLPDHLNSQPTAWAKLQALPGKALRKLDRVVAVAFDESWLADLIVSEARFDRVMFAKPRIIQLASDRLDPLFGDENFQIEWAGNGYRVKRKRDNVFVSDPVATAALAERDLRNQYPKPVPGAVR